MSKSSRQFPPPKLADLSNSSASNILSLSERLSYGVSLVLGAGVSSSAGIPFWSQLLQRMCAGYFEHWQFEIERGRHTYNNPITDMSIAFTNFDSYTSEAKTLGKQLASKDLLLAAQQIKNCIREKDFIYLLRHSLFDPIGYSPRSSKLLDSLAQLCEGGNSDVRSIISYNYDDLIDFALSIKDVETQLVHEGKPRVVKGKGLPLYFVHGITPIKGGYSSRIVLAETDYQQESASPFAWGNQVQIQHFAQRTCVFVGISMTDPNARRLLRLARVTSASPHYCFLPKSDDPDEQLFESLFDYDLRQQGVLTIRFPKRSCVDVEVDAYGRLPELIDLLIESKGNTATAWQ